MPSSPDQPELRRFVRRTLEGIQRPPVFEADDGHEYVLKLDAEYPDFPVAELVSAELASAFEVPLPAFRVLVAPDALTEAMLATGDRDLVSFGESFRRRGGTCFGSRWLPGVVVKWQTALRRRVERADDLLSRIIAFDAFIENGDRTSATNPNLLVSNGQLFAIDHGQALPAVQGATGMSLPYPFASHLAWPILEERPILLEEPMALLHRLDLSRLDEAVAAVPASWWSAPERPALVTRALRRRRDDLLATFDLLAERLR